MTLTRSATGHLYLLTLTAPGDRAHRLPGGEWCACTPVGGVDLAAWNTSHSRRWNHFRTLLRREYPGVQFLRGVEVQSRGALHDHAMTYSRREISLAVVRRLAIRAGFGHSVDLAPCEAGSKRAAYYVSKYVTKATDSRSEVPWVGQRVDTRTGELTLGLVPGRYRTWSMSREWGLTMAQVKAAAREYAVLKAGQAQAQGVADALGALSGALGPVEVLNGPEPAG